MALAGAAPAADAACVSPGPLPRARPAHALRFGITPQLAGSAGAVQAPAAPEAPVTVAVNERPAKSTHNAHAYGRLWLVDQKPEGVSDRDHPFAQHQRVGVAQFRDRQTLPANLQNSYVELVVGTEKEIAAALVDHT